MRWRHRQSWLGHQLDWKCENPQSPTSSFELKFTTSKIVILNSSFGIRNSLGRHHKLNHIADVPSYGNLEMSLTQHSVRSDVVPGG